MTDNTAAANTAHPEQSHPGRVLTLVRRQAVAAAVLASRGGGLGQRRRRAHRCRHTGHRGQGHRSQGSGTAVRPSGPAIGAEKPGRMISGGGVDAVVASLHDTCTVGWSRFYNFFENARSPPPPLSDGIFNADHDELNKICHF